MRQAIFLLVWVAASVALLAGCGGGSSAADGERLYKQASIENREGCDSCHSLEPGVMLVGPSLAGIASRAGEQVPGMTAEEYLRQSIIDPDAYVAEDFQPGVMPLDWARALSEKQVDDLVAFLLTLE